LPATGGATHLRIRTEISFARVAAGLMAAPHIARRAPVAPADSPDIAVARGSASAQVVASPDGHCRGRYVEPKPVVVPGGDDAGQQHDPGGSVGGAAGKPGCCPGLVREPRWWQFGLRNVPTTPVVQKVYDDLVQAHAQSYQFTFYVSAALALVGAVASAALVRKVPVTIAGRVFTRRSRWVLANAGATTPALTRRPPPADE